MEPKANKTLRKRTEPEVVVTVNWLKPEDDPVRYPIYCEWVRKLVRKAMSIEVQPDSRAECAD